MEKENQREYSLGLLIQNELKPNLVLFYEYKGKLDNLQNLIDLKTYLEDNLNSLNDITSSRELFEEMSKRVFGKEKYKGEIYFGFFPKNLDDYLIFYNQPNRELNSILILDEKLIQRKGFKYKPNLERSISSDESLINL